MILKPELPRYVSESPEQCLSEFLAAFREAQEQTQDHYVTSFCTACDEWVPQNGLLSQWRGYGQDGGYAIVFDTKGLDSLLRNDAGHYHDSEETLVFGDVQYDEAIEELSFVPDKQVLDHVQRVRDSLLNVLRGRGPGKTIKRLTVLPCYPHFGNIEASRRRERCE